VAKIKVKTLHQSVADLIREMIYKGDLGSDQKINESHLCEAFGVSRTPVREALRMLRSEGLVNLVPQKGAYVCRRLSIEEMEDMFNVMSMLEGMCARIATQKMDEKNFQKIETLHQKLEEKYANRDYQGYVDVNNRLHVFIQKLSGNKALDEVVNSLRQKILLYRYRQLYYADRLDKSIVEHRRILEAFRKRDVSLAESLMQEHLLKHCEALKEYTLNEQKEKGVQTLNSVVSG